MKIAINTCYGGFYLSKKAIQILKERGYPDLAERCWDVEDQKSRTHPVMVQVIEELGKDASWDGDVKIIEIPDDVKDWYIEDNDGFEHIGEGRRWHYKDQNKEV
ncbi:MAG: hypothetical protein KAS32_20525 [Candidatus Peribacteraceae bacterium]|nr:hypothetical protein [Candidatus Peribacteraceae bacterium]